MLRDEDAARARTMLTSLPPGDVPERVEEVNCMILADGMGGHAAGELASRSRSARLVSLALDIPDWILKLDSRGGDGRAGVARGTSCRRSGR
jgi:serine/threonine protein phosphatase PrpC